MKLMLEDQVFLLFGYVGTPTVTRVLPLLKKFQDENIFMFFPFTGAQPQRQPPYGDFAFNLRASYAQETAGLVNNFVGIGRQRIAGVLPGGRLRPQRLGRRPGGAGPARPAHCRRGHLQPRRELHRNHAAAGGNPQGNVSRRGGVHRRLRGLRGFCPGRRGLWARGPDRQSVVRWQREHAEAADRRAARATRPTPGCWSTRRSFPVTRTCPCRRCANTANCWISTIPRFRPSWSRRNTRLSPTVSAAWKASSTPSCWRKSFAGLRRRGRSRQAGAGGVLGEGLRPGRGRAGFIRTEPAAGTADCLLHGRRGRPVRPLTRLAGQVCMT